MPLLFVLATRTAIYAVQGRERLLQVAEEWRFVYQKEGPGWQAVDVSAEEVKVLLAKAAKARRVKVYCQPPPRARYS